MVVRCNSMLAGALEENPPNCHITVLQPKNALLGIHVDASLSMADEFVRNPGKKVGISLCSPAVLDHGEPGVPGRGVVNIEEPFRFDLGGSVSELVVREIYEHASSLE